MEGAKKCIEVAVTGQTVLVGFLFGLVFSAEITVQETFGPDY